jgi:hypothetical protein
MSFVVLDIYLVGGCVVVVVMPLFNITERLSHKISKVIKYTYSITI